MVTRQGKMFVNEEGLLKKLFQNPLASLVAGRQIVGMSFYWMRIDLNDRQTML